MQTYKMGFISIMGHTILPLVSSLVAAFFTPETLDWFILALWSSIFALYQYLIDPLLFRDKIPSWEYWEFSIYVVLYSLFNVFDVV